MHVHICNKGRRGYQFENYDMISVGEEIGWVWREEGKEKSDLIMFQLTFIKTFKK